METRMENRYNEFGEEDPNGIYNEFGEDIGPPIETLSFPASQSKGNPALSVADALTPNRKLMYERGKSEWQKAFPDAPGIVHEIGGGISGLGGLGMDGLSMAGSVARPLFAGFSAAVQKGISSPIVKKITEKAGEIVSKPLGSFSPLDKAASIAKAAGKEAFPFGGSTVPASKSLSAIAAKNAAINTADAAAFNNMNRVLAGEEMELGTAELAGGLLGGSVGTAGEKVMANKILKGRNFAIRKAESVNFAEKMNPGLKDKRAVEKVIDDNIKQFGTLDNAVDKLRAENDRLNAQMRQLLKSNGAKEVPIPVDEMKKKLDLYVLDNTSFLGHGDSKTYTASANNIFDDYMRNVLVNRRLAANPGTNRRTVFDEVDLMPIEKVFGEVGFINLNEFDKIKRNMQKRTSHYARSKSSMAREGTESLANKESAEAMNDLLSGMETVEDAVLEKMKSGVALEDEVAKEYKRLNFKRHKAIGNQKIMEQAEFINSRRDDYISGLTNTLSELNAANRKLTSPANRWFGSELEKRTGLFDAFQNQMGPGEEE
jgi:hypothetical protein